MLCFRRTLFCLFAVTLWAALSDLSDAAVGRSRNFVVTTADPQLAEIFASTAEQQRRDLAISWLGKELPDWSSPCKIKVKVGANLPPGGATTFVFSNGQVFGWDMNIQGSVERVLDSVLPHEITHMIFACKFRQPVPRWADEGAATSVEHSSERNKYRRMLIGFLQTNRGIAFRTMVNADEYPPDAMPFYAQSYTAAEYLIARGGRKRYIAFVEDGINSNDWSAALRKYYGYPNLGEFQNVWVNWVGRGYPFVQNDLVQRDLLASNQNPNSGANSGAGAGPAYNSYAMANNYQAPGNAGYASANNAAAVDPNRYNSAYNNSGYTNVQVSRPEPNLIIRTPVSTAHPRSVTDAISGSFNGSTAPGSDPAPVSGPVGASASIGNTQNQIQYQNQYQNQDQSQNQYQSPAQGQPAQQNNAYQGTNPGSYQGSYQEATRLSYNAVAPAIAQPVRTNPAIVQTSAVEAPSQSSKTLRWLPANTQALYEEPVAAAAQNNYPPANGSNRATAGIYYDAPAAGSFQR